MTTLQKVAIAVMLLSIVIGIAGTAWSIYLSFAALEMAENAGIGPVGDNITNAMVFTAVGLVGSLIGVVLFILGRKRT